MAGMLAGMAGGATVAVLINAVDNASGVFAKVNKNMLGIGLAAVGVGVAVGAALSSTVGPASDLRESINAVTVAYGKNAEGVLAIGQNAAKSFGMSKSQFNEAAVSFSAFAEKIVGAEGDVVGTLEKITTRTADFASVMNIDLARAQTLVQAGLAGETEGLRRFGIDVSAATIKIYAMENGIGTLGEELTEAEKIQARYGSIIQQTGKFAGDFQNTSDEWANSTRILSATMIDLKASLGEHLIPMLTTLIGWIQQGVDWFNKLSPATKKIIVGVAGLAAGLLILGGVIIMLTAITAAFNAVNWVWIGIIALVLLAIAALVAAGLWLWKNWDSIVENFKKAGVTFRNVFIGIHNVVMKVWNGIVNYIEQSINKIIGMINRLISKINKIPGINIGKIGEVSFEKMKGEEMAYAVYKPSESSSGNTTNIVNINGDINGMTGADIADSLQGELTKKVALS